MRVAASNRLEGLRPAGPVNPSRSIPYYSVETRPSLFRRVTDNSPPRFTAGWPTLVYPLTRSDMNSGRSKSRHSEIHLSEGRAGFEPTSFGLSRRRSSMPECSTN